MGVSQTKPLILAVSLFSAIVTAPVSLDLIEFVCLENEKFSSQFRN